MPQIFNFSTDYILEDERALLRPMRENDYENLLPFALQEPEIWKYSLQPAAGEAGLKAYMDAAFTGKKEQKEYPFIVFDKQAQKYAGSTRFYDMQLQNQTLQLGYTWYGNAFQGTGLNKHCKFLLLQFAFDDLEMERVEFRADSNNKKSIAAMQSIGCVVEGVLRNHLPTADGNRRDSIILSILKQEWNSKVKQMLLQKLTG